MMDIRAASRAVMATRLIGDVVKDENDAAKVIVRELMHDTGAERVRVTDESGANLGAVSVAAGRVSARVTDEAAFLAWVQQRYPSEMQVVVREAFRKQLLATAGKAGDPVDISTGEVIPGVELAEGDPYIVVRPTPEARDRMRTMLANSGLLMLPGGESGDA